MSGLMEYNGSAVLAMAGKNCVGIACDRRLGINRFSTVSTDFPKAFRLNDRTFVGFAGLATDVQTLHLELRFRMNLYSLREEREMEPQVVSNLLASLLYGRRFSPWLVGPVVAGLDKNDNPFLSAFDFIGADCRATDFVANGTAAEQMMGVCESFYKPDMEPEDLFETLSQCMLAGLDRDCVSGWGANVHIITPKEVISRSLKSRMD